VLEMRLSSTLGVQTGKLAVMQEELSDERLMLAYRDGETAAFERLYGRYRTRLYRHLAHQCGDPRLAEDIYQDVWQNIISARAEYEPLAKFSTWIFRIAHHRLIDHYRRQSRNVASLFDDEADPELAPAPTQQNPAQLAENQEISIRLAAALQALPEPQREAFLLAEEGGLTLEEIANATACGRETVKSRLRYATSKLRDSLRDLL